MSIRGEIVIECDTKACHGEIVLPVTEDDAVEFSSGVSIDAMAPGWRYTGDRFVCPQCIEEWKK